MDSLGVAPSGDLGLTKETWGQTVRPCQKFHIGENCALLTSTMCTWLRIIHYKCERLTGRLFFQPVPLVLRVVS